MKNTNFVFYPGWAEHHIPAPGSERPYNGLAGAEHVQAMSTLPPTPEGQMGAEEMRQQRELFKLERLAS